MRLWRHTGPHFNENEAWNQENGDVHACDFESWYLKNQSAHEGQWWLILLDFSCSFIWAQLVLTLEFPFKHLCMFIAASGSSWPFSNYGFSFNFFQVLLEFIMALKRVKRVLGKLYNIIQLFGRLLSETWFIWQGRTDRNIGSPLPINQISDTNRLNIFNVISEVR